MTTIICRITMNLRVTAYADPKQDPSRLQTCGHGSDHVLSSFRPAVREERVESFGMRTIMSAGAGGVDSFAIRSPGLSTSYDIPKEDPEDHISDLNKPFANGNGYGDYAFQRKAFDEGHAI